MKVLVIGAKGQLGFELCRGGKKQGLDVVAVDLPEFDISNFSLVKKMVSKIGASLVINAAAYTDVDKAESEAEFAFAVNRDGPAYLASCCAHQQIPLVHISTDYVFDGKKAGPYVEIDPVCPISVYGESKAAGEKEIRSNLPFHIIIRTSWLYGVHGRNFVKTMLHLGNHRNLVRVVADQYGCPTYVKDLSYAIFEIAERIWSGDNIDWGTYHYCGKGETTWHGFAEKIFDIARNYCSLTVKEVKPITTEEYPTPAKRPANSVLDCALITKTFGVKPSHWEESLQRAILALLKS